MIYFRFRFSEEYIQPYLRGSASGAAGSTSGAGRLRGCRLRGGRLCPWDGRLRAQPPGWPARLSLRLGLASGAAGSARLGLASGSARPPMRPAPGSAQMRSVNLGSASGATGRRAAPPEAGPRSRAQPPGSVRIRPNRLGWAAEAGGSEQPSGSQGPEILRIAAKIVRRHGKVKL